MRKILVAVVLSLLLTGLMAEKVMAKETATSQFEVRVFPQARIDVDGSNIIRIINITGGSNVQPPYLNIYQGGVKVNMTPAIQANLDSISPQIDWSQGGLVYQQGGIVQTATASVKAASTPSAGTGLSEKSGPGGFWISARPFVVDMPTPVDSGCIVTRRYYLEWGKSLGLPCLVVVEKFESF